MIEEDYVSFEIAKLLKEKGFDECPLYRYDDCGQFWAQGGYDKTKKWHFPAPTLQMAMKWLRNVHKLFIFISPWIMRENNIQYYFEIREIKTNDFEVIYDHTSKELSSYEKACESAIKYCLENLI